MMEPVLLNDRYRLLELVGSGGMAAVYRGEDILLERQVAVKVLREGFAGDPAFLARFQREARAAAQLDHPNVVRVYDVGQDGDRHYIVMEYVDGQDLKTMIRRSGRLTVEEALSICVQVSAAVGHAHEGGVVHCDIKPQNVLVTLDGRAKVTDFGIARALSESALTESETVWGSPLYFSPEQAAGDPTSPASDVYSIGVVMYEMLAGQPPFSAEKPMALALMHMRQQPPPLVAQNPQLPPTLEAIVQKMMAKDPAARYRTAGQVASVLAEYRAQSDQMTGMHRAAVSVSPILAPAGPEVADLGDIGLSAAESDRLTRLLGVVAAAAVVGLVPLWWIVYQSWALLRPPLPSTATATPLVVSTSTAVQILVPDLLNRSEEDARAILDQAGLLTASVEQRDAPGVGAGVVLDQVPAPGEFVDHNTGVAIVVSAPPRSLSMPKITDLPAEEVQDGLQTDGLQVTLDTVWSPVPIGTVLEQHPPAGTPILAGDAVTLTVSGGVEAPIELNVQLANQVLLKSAQLRQDSFPLGGTLRVTLHWLPLGGIDANYVVFVHLLGPDGALMAQQDAEPPRATTDWVEDAEVVDPRQVVIPANSLPQPHQLRVGMYPQGQPSSRVSIIDAGLTTVEDDSILVAEILVGH